MGVVKLNQSELALRMLEAAVGFRRPPGLSAEDALACGHENLRSAYERAAQAALVYFVECAGPITILGGQDVASADRSPVRKIESVN